MIKQENFKLCEKGDLFRSWTEVEGNGHLLVLLLNSSPPLVGTHLSFPLENYSPSESVLFG